jgi:hypothetical protein
MKKIYCKDCKYCYYEEDSSYPGDFCCSIRRTYASNYYTEYETYTTCESKNKNNKCLDYKKYWYKFWIK